MAGPGVFICYRRDDSAGHAGRLYDRLSERFGRDRLFIDVDTLTPGTDFVSVIDETLARSGVLLAVIGTDWESARDGQGRRRLDDPEDFVRLEIVTALERGTPVIPVLVRRAKMPSAESLPEPLHPLGRRHALELDDARWGQDVGRLIEILDRLLGEPTHERRSERSWRSLTTRGRVGISAALLAVAVAGAIALMKFGGDGGASASTTIAGPSAPPSQVKDESPSPAPGRVLLNDGFSPAVADRWFVQDTGPVRWIYSGGRYSITIDDPTYRWFFSDTGFDPNLSALSAVGVQVAVSDMTGPARAGLICRSKGTDSYSFYGAYVTRTGRYGFEKIDGSITHLSRGTGVPMRPDGAALMRLDCVEDPTGGVRLTLWVNGRFVDDLLDTNTPLLAPGRVGVFIASRRRPAGAVFDNFVVRDLSA